MKPYKWVILITLFAAVAIFTLSCGRHAYMRKDLYCLEVGWDEESQEYFNTHHVECKFNNVLRNGSYVLTMHAEIPKEGDICHEIDESTDPPSFTDVACEYTFDDWVAAGSPSEYVIEGQTCLANFIFMINEELEEGDQVWGVSPVVTFTPSGNIKSTCIGP